MINPAFGEKFLTTVNDLQANPVHFLFNQWWAEAPDEVKQAYVAQVENDPRYGEFLSGGQFADPLDLDALGAMDEGTLGRTYHGWIVDNGLADQIAMDYGKFHDHLRNAGQLDGMPEPMQYAVLRGFQTHDFQHVVTGYGPDGLGEIALQAFCLAQIQFPYFGMWISVTTTRMTFVQPHSIVPLMDAITDGWRLGRAVRNIQVEKWEQMLDTPVVELRAQFGFAPEGRAAA